MITLSKKLKEPTKRGDGLHKVDKTGRISVRDKLLVKEVQEMQQHLPTSCHIHFNDPDKLYEFTLTITPDEGIYLGGKFKFHISVPLEYNIMPPTVKCATRIWHPNINETGQVCLSLLRLNSLDSMGWAPTRRLKDVVWGLASLFSDLLNFDDPLNVEAAEHYERDKEDFKAKVQDYISRYSRR